MINVNYTANLELDEDQAIEFMAEMLQNDFVFITDEINDLRNIGANLTVVQGADLINSMNVRDAMQTLLKYYMVKEDYDAFMAEFGR